MARRYMREFIAPQENPISQRVLWVGGLLIAATAGYILYQRSRAPAVTVAAGIQTIKGTPGTTSVGLPTGASWTNINGTPATGNTPIAVPTPTQLPQTLVWTSAQGALQTTVLNLTA